MKLKSISKNIISLFLSLTILIMSLLLVTKVFGGVQIKDVVLTIGANHSQKIVTFYTDDKVNAEVEYQPASFEDDFKNAKKATVSSYQNSKKTAYTNSATLSNLSTNTEYEYRIKTDNTVSKIYKFTVQDKDNFIFLAIGDPQLGATGINLNANAWIKNLDKIENSVPNPAFMISLGDQVNTSDSDEEYSEFLAPEFMKSVALAPVIGNHDDDTPDFSEHFGLPNVTPYGKNAAGSDYYFAWGKTLFLVMNANINDAETHRQMMNEAISKYPDSEYKILCFHQSIYSAGIHATEPGILSKRENFVPLIDEFNIDLVLMGHDHIYTRTPQMKNNQEVKSEVKNLYKQGNGTVYTTLNSSSGSKFYPAKLTPLDYAKVKDQSYRTNYTTVEVTPKALYITTYATSDNKIIDKFIIEKQNTSSNAEDNSTKPTENENNTVENQDSKPVENSTENQTTKPDESSKKEQNISKNTENNNTKNNEKTKLIKDDKTPKTSPKTSVQSQVVFLIVAILSASTILVAVRKAPIKD
ncbi:MAG: metallophosphoesterase family protein [Clostridia bacterium]|nr:metallophosphoesterase family protein [Clostridia bacterium]